MTTALYTPEAGFNRSAIMADAWTRTRSARKGRTVAERRARFAFNLSAAWKAAKNLRDYATAAADRAAQEAATIAAVPVAERATRAAALRHAATAEEMLDRNGTRAAAAYRMRRETEALDLAA